MLALEAQVKRRGWVLLTLAASGLVVAIYEAPWWGKALVVLAYLSAWGLAERERALIRCERNERFARRVSEYGTGHVRVVDR